MVAIVTDPLRKKFANLLFNEVQNSTDINEYYLGIGKSDPYDGTDTTITPARNIKDERIARGNLQSIKKVTGNSFVIPRFNWTSGSIYSGWSDASIGIPTNTYYILTEDNEVYICIQQGKNAAGQANTSIVKPSFTTAGVGVHQAFQTSDGYRWKLAYTISASRASTFLSSTFIPAQDQALIAAGDSAGSGAFELQQNTIRNLRTPGQILGVEIVDGGTGYSSAPTITFKGNGNGAAATASISGGTIVKIEMDNESSGMGSGYDYASAVVTGNATLRPIIGPRDGLGFSALDDLKSTSVMFNIKPAGAEGGTFNTTNDFRQILLLRNLDLTDSSGGEGPRYAGTASKVNRFMTIGGTISASNFVVDEKITGASGVTAFIDELDSGGGNKIFFHQNENTVNGNFGDGEAITGNAVGSATTDSGNKFSAVDIYSGELLYIENRARVIRASAQTEDIKVIITV